MTELKILIVEDEQLVARDLQLRLRRMGYEVPAIAASAEEALALLFSTEPNLVLTDIRLGSESDGIDLAAKIYSEFDLPVIYTTAFSDNETLERARMTQPYGYVIKPFQDRDLQIAIENAAYKHKAEMELRENRSWLAAVLQSIGDAVIATDFGGRVVFLNPAAETLTEWTQEEARGMNLDLVFNVLSRRKFYGPWLQLSESESVKADGFMETILISKKGRERPIYSTVSLLKDNRGRQIGEVVVFQDTTLRETRFQPALV